MDIEHNYIEQGTGFPLILLHGNGEDVSYFVHQMEPFSRYFRVIAVDTRGRETHDAASHRAGLLDREVLRKKEPGGGG